MDVAIAGMAGNARNKIVFFGKGQNGIDELRFLIDGYDDIFLADNQAFRPDGFSKGLAGLPDAGRIGDENGRGTVCRADFVQEDGFVVHVVFTGTLYFDDEIITAVAVL